MLPQSTPAHQMAITSSHVSSWCNGFTQAMYSHCQITNILYMSVLGRSQSWHHPSSTRSNRCQTIGSAAQQINQKIMITPYHSPARCCDIQVCTKQTKSMLLFKAIHQQPKKSTRSATNTASAGGGPRSLHGSFTMVSQHGACFSVPPSFEVVDLKRQGLPPPLHMYALIPKCMHYYSTWQWFIYVVCSKYKQSKNNAKVRKSYIGDCPRCKLNKHCPRLRNTDNHKS